MKKAAPDGTAVWVLDSAAQPADDPAMRLGPEFRGKLPPGAREDIDRSLRGWRESGLVSGVEILAGDCPVADALAGFVFPIGNPPTLPIAGCELSPCCGCTFLAVQDIEDGSHARRINLPLTGPARTD
jgi:hypothetical protein